MKFTRNAPTYTIEFTEAEAEMLEMIGRRNITIRQAIADDMPFDRMAELEIWLRDLRRTLVESGVKIVTADHPNGVPAK